MTRPRATRAWLVLQLAACAAEDAPAPPSPYAELESALTTRMRAEGIVGMAAARITAGEVKWTHAFGFADYEARRLATVDTPFMVASVSKTFVALVLARGGFQLDAPIDDAFGAPMRDPDVPEIPITPRMLATHTSGLIDDWIALGAESTEGDAPKSLESFARDYWSSAHFGAAPGSRRSYSNAGFGVLGAFVELASQETLPALTRRHVLDPLHMGSSGWHLSDFDESTLAIPYNGKLDDGLIRYHHEGYGFYSATSMRTSVHDLSTFLATFINRGVAPDGTRVYSEEVAALFETAQFPMIDEDQGFVWYYDELGGRRVLGHTGSALGFSALMFMDPATRDGAILLTNSDAFVRGRLGEREASRGLYDMTAAILDFVAP